MSQLQFLPAIVHRYHTGLCANSDLQFSTFSCLVVSYVEYHQCPCQAHAAVASILACPQTVTPDGFHIGLAVQVADG